MNKEKWRSKEKNVTNYERDTPLGSSVYSAPLLTGARLVFVTQLNCTSMRLTNSTNCPDFLHPPAEKYPQSLGVYIQPIVQDLSAMYHVVLFFLCLWHNQNAMRLLIEFISEHLLELACEPSAYFWRVCDAILPIPPLACNWAQFRDLETRQRYARLYEKRLWSIKRSHLDTG